MKKQIFTLGLMLAATFTLTNCDKISDNEQFAKNDFTIFATPSVETKTVNDGVTSSWKADDALSVMHAVAGSSNYVKDGKFVVAENDVDAGRFTGELGEALDASKSYDWYMIYPYSGKMADPVNDGVCYFYVGRGATQAQTQKGNNSMDHLSGIDVPLYATAKGLAGSSTPTVDMHHLCAAVAFNLTNNSAADLIVSSIEFTSTEPIVGTYYINIAGDEPVYVSSGESYVSNTAKLTVSGGSAIKKGNSAKFYMAIKPHTVAKGGKISIKVTANDGSTYTNDINVSSAATFKAGKIQTINVDYSRPETLSGYVFSWASASDWTFYTKDNCDDPLLYGAELSKDGYKVSAVKNSGSSSPTVNATSNDFRSYAKNTVTISNSSKAMTEMVFTISAQGQKRLTDITASTGNVTIDTDNWTVTWKGSAKSVDFTVGEKATYGTEGNTKAGQFDFNYFTIK